MELSRFPPPPLSPRARALSLRRWDPPVDSFPANAPRRRGEARTMPDFDAIAASVRSEQKKSKERKIALNTAQWTTQEGRDAHYEQAPWSTVQGQSSADMAKAARAVGARGCLLYTSPSPRDRQKSRMPSSA